MHQPHSAFGQHYDLVARVRDLIKEFGYATPTVAPDPTTGTPAFTYTIGLRLHTVHDGYELVTVGLPADLAGSIVQRTVEYLAAQSIIPSHGLILPQIAGEYSVRLHRARNCDWFINGMRTLATPADPEVWQILVPDKHGVFPGDTDYPADQLRAQPLL
ncbi:DUF4262 domain-containing protein [Streptomyces sp. NPDC001948]